jgi:hypothetical protein
VKDSPAKAQERGPAEARISEKVVDDSLKLTRDQRIGKKVVGASLDRPEVVGPVSCPRNHNQRQGRPKDLSNAQQIRIAAISQYVLADDKTTVTLGDIEDGLLYGCRKDGRNAAVEKRLTERAADGRMPRNDKTVWIRDFAITLPPQNREIVRAAQPRIACGDFPFHRQGTVFKSIHGILPGSFWQGCGMRTSQRAWLAKNKPTAGILSGELPQPHI